jgi:HD-GYP domain-containing protein (c-di-GMP phosphodiesterase class II)
MAHLIVWGSTRDIVAGNLPGITPVEVSCLAGLEASLDGRGAALVLADPARLDAERDATEKWLRSGGATRAVLVAVAEAGQEDAVLSQFPFVDDLLLRPVTAARLRHRLERAFEAVQNRRVIQQLERQVSRKGDELSELNKIGVALTAERNIQKLLELILSKSREITGADAGSLYLVERATESGDGSPDQLRFKLTQNDTVTVPFRESTMRLDQESTAGYVACTGLKVNLPDAYHPPEGVPYHFSKSFDEASGYRTKSMLVVPMRDHKDEVIGVIQLINKKRDRGAVLQPVSVVEEEVIPFTSVDEDLAGSLASQAAVAFENADLIDRIQRLFDEFVLAAVSAVEQRDLPTSGHSRRVAELTVAIAEKVDAATTGPFAGLHFTRDQMQEIRYAALLHDFGKVAVQEKVLGKRKKLYGSRMVAVRQRFAYILKAREADYLRERLDRVSSGRATQEDLAMLETEYRLQRAETERLLQAVIRANEPTVVEQDSFAVLASLPAPRRFANHEDETGFPVEDWSREPFLSAGEVEALSIRRGTLTADEWVVMKSHVSHTYEFLRKIPWTGELSRIPEIAWAHHEKLDGSGYPRHLEGKDNIPVQSRMMTISDIYDALAALDRPYKRAVPVGRALEILEQEAGEGKLDEDLLTVFLDAKIYDLPAFKALIRPRT